MSDNRNRALLIGGGILLALLFFNRANAAPKIPKPADIPGGNWLNVGGSWRWVADSAAGALPGSPSAPGSSNPASPPGGSGDVWCESCAQPPASALPPVYVAPRSGDDEIAPPTPVWAFPGEPEPAPRYIPPPPPSALPPPPPSSLPPLRVAPPDSVRLPPVVNSYTAPPNVFVLPSTGPVTYDNRTNTLVQVPPPPGAQWFTSTENGVTEAWAQPVDSFFSGN